MTRAALRSLYLKWLFFYLVGNVVDVISYAYKSNNVLEYVITAYRFTKHPSGTA